MAEQTATLEQPTASDAGQDALGSAISAMEAKLFPADGATTEQAPSAAAQPTSSDQVAPTEQPAAQQPAQEPGGDEDLDEGLDQPQEQGKPTSRMGRLRAQLTQAEETAKQAREQLQQQQAKEADAIRQFVDLVLPDAQFEQLRLAAEGGDWEAKQKLDTARTWRRMAAPIADLAHRAAAQEFNQALVELRTLDGMDGDSHEKLIAARSPAEKLRLMWQLARRERDDFHKERIATLEAEVQSLKTTRAANGTQPAAGGTPAQGSSGLAGLLGRDGQLTDDALNLTPAEIRQRFRVA